MELSIENKLLQEQLLQEAFLDSVKAYAKDKLNQAVDTISDWKDAAVVFGKILSDEELLKDFLSPLQRRFEEILKSLYSFLEKLGLNSFINTINSIKNKIYSLEGWKKLLVLTGIGAIAYYVINTLKNLPKDKISTYIKDYFSIDFFNNLISSTALASWSSFIGVLQPVIQGVQAIYGFLKDLINKFSAALKSNSKFATKLVKENKMNNLRELIRQAIAEVIEEENATSGGEAYMTKFAFSKGGKNRATKYAEKLGMKIVGKQPKHGKTFDFIKYESLVSKVLSEKLYILTPNAFGKINPKAITLDGSVEVTEKNIKKSEHKEQQEIVDDMLNEASYRSFSKTVSKVSPQKKMDNAIREINKRLKEIDQLTEYTLRLREENNITTENQLTNSVKGLGTITERIAKIYKKIKTLKE